MKSDELRILREALKKQSLEAEQNKQAFELQIKQITKEYEAVKKDQEKRYQDMVFKLQVAEQHAADERGVLKKVEKCYKIARNELCAKYKRNEDDENKNCKTQSSTKEDDHEKNEKLHGNQLNRVQKKLTKLWKEKGDCNLLGRAAIGGGIGAASVGTVGAGAGAIAGAGAGAVSVGAVIGAAGALVGGVAGAVVGGAAGIILGPCALATAAAGGAAGAAAGGAAGTAAGAAAGAVVGGAVGAVVGGGGGAAVGAAGGAAVVVAVGGGTAGCTGGGGISDIIATLYIFPKC